MASTPKRPPRLGLVGGPTKDRRRPPDDAPEVEIKDPVKYFAGDVIGGKYRLTSVLGEGGMGSVWLARNTALDVDVAVKLIRREAATPESSQRLLQEARAAARLGHPSIVRIYDFGETEYRDPFIVMEVLKGQSLGDILDLQGRLPAERAVQTLLPIASALAAAHAKGIIHRDLKPDNIVLVSDDSGLVPKVVDFGIAKLSHDDAARHTTQAGIVLGSPDYMSPEQARGREDVDERTDVWSLTVVLYELVSGRPPFSGGNYNALMMAILEESPVPTTEYGAGDAALWAILARGLAKERDQRWSSMKELGRALAGWALENGIDHDLAGTSLRLHWLEDSSARRSIASLPQLDRPSRTGLVASVPPASGDEPATNVPDLLVSAPVVPVHLPADTLPAEGPEDRSSKVAAVWSPEPRPPRRSSPARAIVLIALALAGTGAFLGRGAITGWIGAAPPTTAATPAPAPRGLVAEPVGDAPAPPTAATAAPAPATASAVVGASASASTPAGSAAGASAAAAAVAAGPSAGALSTASASVSAGPTPAGSAAAASSGAAATGPARGATPADMGACAMPLFAAGTFRSPPDLAYVCTETDPRRGASRMKEAVVGASRGQVTEGMREWAVMAWYELAAFAVVRGRCCSAAAPLVLPAPVGACVPLDEALNDLAAKVAAGVETGAALDRFTSAVHCVVTSGTSAHYGYASRPRGGEDAPLRKMLARAAR